VDPETLASSQDDYYTFDDVNRLATYDRGELNANQDAISGTPVSEEDWGLDMTGNWSDFTQKSSGATDLDQDRTHNEVNEITQISETTGTGWVDPVHDQAGNMTTVPKPSGLSSGLSCKWDAWNHLVEVKDGATVVARYEYDGLARRVKKHLDSQSPENPDGIDAYVHYLYNGAWQVFETRESASENTGPENLQPQYQYVWSQRYIDAPVLRDENTDADGACDAQRVYYLGDANFNVTTLVDTGGAAVERYIYSPYGVLTIHDATWSNIRSASSYDIAYTYTGRRLDGETGLYYYRHRVYHARLGRFGSRDPIGYAGGDLSLYLYAVSNPSTFWDPSGLQKTTDWQERDLSAEFQFDILAWFDLREIGLVLPGGVAEDIVRAFNRIVASLTADIKMSFPVRSRCIHGKPEFQVGGSHTTVEPWPNDLFDPIELPDVGNIAMLSWGIISAGIHGTHVAHLNPVERCPEGQQGFKQSIEVQFQLWFSAAITLSERQRGKKSITIGDEKLLLVGRSRWLSITEDCCSSCPEE
jgi:RHS repeat-associated protein